MRNISILYVEDEATLRESMSVMLTYLPSKLYTAANGEEGLALYKEHQPDIVITDIKMPKMNGIEMVKAIRQINNNQHIIFTSAHSESQYFIDAIELQADAYMLKPVDLDRLEEKLYAITRQINLSKEFQEQRELLHEIAHLQNNLILVLDHNQDSLFANKQFLEFFDIHDEKEFSQRYGSLIDTFIKSESFYFPSSPNPIDWIEELYSYEEDQRIVKIANAKAENRLFHLALKEVSQSGHILIILHEMTTLALKHLKYERQAYMDELTQTYNRNYFNEIIEMKVLAATNSNTALSCILYDIDHFKRVNDHHGHLVGDQILKELSSLVSSRIRESDTLIRWGGEEFIIILPHTTAREAYQLANALREKIEQHSFSNGLHITCSFGVHQYSADDTRERCFKSIDDALYHAKKSGRNQVFLNHH